MNAPNQPTGATTEVVHTTSTGDNTDSDGQPLRTCLSCGTLPVETHPHWGARYDNALLVSVHGGYGLFFDDMDEPTKEFVLCHDCSHALFTANPWLKALFDPALSHSHTLDYRAAHPDHYGWDYDFDRDRAAATPNENGGVAP